jgi:hypothetical protein
LLLGHHDGLRFGGGIALSVAKAPGLPATAVATVKTAIAVRAIRLFMVTPLFLDGGIVRDAT